MAAPVASASPHPVRVGRDDAVRAVTIGAGRFTLIAGPCVVESTAHCLMLARALADACAARGVPFVFKASFDKANRTSGQSARGPGQEAGLAALAAVRRELGVPVTTDVHEASQVPAVAAVVDLLQVPAFLSRQTDLLSACGQSGLPVNVKKGQFLAPWDMAHALAKVGAARPAGAPQAVLLTERGASFGYHNLVVDMRGLPLMRALGAPVCIDCTHAVQLPGAAGDRSGGQREMAPVLARAAMAVGVDAVFAEVHEDPDRAPSDGPNMQRLESVPGLLWALCAIEDAVRGAAEDGGGA
jgi:2-dehydro-3-deoxyphosphooctonate aldolase (KDO 8-P synthase)